MQLSWNSDDGEDDDDDVDPSQDITDLDIIVFQSSELAVLTSFLEATHKSAANHRRSFL